MSHRETGGGSLTPRCRFGKHDDVDLAVVRRVPGTAVRRGGHALDSGGSQSGAHLERIESRAGWVLERGGVWMADGVRLVDHRCWLCSPSWEQVWRGAYESERKRHLLLGGIRFVWQCGC